MKLYSLNGVLLFEFEGDNNTKYWINSYYGTDVIFAKLGFLPRHQL